MDKRKGQRQIRRNMPQRTSDGHRHRGNDRILLLLMIICGFLILNFLFILHLQIQIGNVKKIVNQALLNQTSAQISTGSMQNQQLSSGASKGSYGVGTVGNNGNSETISGSSQSGDNQSVSNQGANNEGGQDITQTSGSEEDVDYVELCGLPEVARPVKRNSREVLARLSELAQDSVTIENIYENASSYPDKMLEALANNPEMADYVAGYLDREEYSDSSAERGNAERGNIKDGKTESKITKREMEQEYPLFLQWDPRWGYEEYGEYSNVGLAGCGPTCLSMVMYYLLENEELTPDKIAKYSMDNGYYVWGTGTAWALLEEYPVLYGVDVEAPGKSEETMKAALDQGRFIICSMGPGDFTTAGHFIVIYGYDEDGFKVNDSNCVARSRKRWTYDEIGWQIKQIWTYGKGYGKPAKNL